MFLKFFGLTEMSVMGRKLTDRCRSYLNYNELQIDESGMSGNYDLVVTCSDLVIQPNIKDKKIILVQEGMTDPENWLFHIARYLKFLPRWIASTSTTGLSDAYSYFCVASNGYRNHFIKKGVNPGKIKVTGIPNFDNCKLFLTGEFPYRNYVLVCTSDSRETLKYENRKQFILNAVKISNGRKLIFKLHPNENFKRASAEILKWAPDSVVYTSGNTEEMIAHCDVLITRYSSTVFTGMALGKEVYSDFDLTELRKLTPIQNGGQSANNIAEICREVILESNHNTISTADQSKLSPRQKSKVLEYFKFAHTLFN